MFGAAGRHTAESKQKNRDIELRRGRLLDPDTGQFQGRLRVIMKNSRGVGSARPKLGA
jgi:hypothetical protein